MGPTVGRRKGKRNKGSREIIRGLKTKARTRDLDNIFGDMKEIGKLLNQPEDPDLPGFGQNYCVECARHFITSEAKEEHLRTKAHKKRVKILKTEKPYTQEEAEAAVGLMAP
jgi:bud site selection protein 20